MTGEIFVDTSAWVALYARKDQYHEQAKEVHGVLTHSGRRCVMKDED